MKHKQQITIVLALLFMMGLSGSSYAISPVLREMEDAFIGLHEELQPCVVTIDVRGSAKSNAHGEMENYDELFRYFGLPDPEDMRMMPKRRSRMGQGSGFFYDKKGHIITNNHVIEGADTITVKLWDGKEFDAEVVGADPDTDLAVIKIDPGDIDITVAKLGDSDALKVGQFAIAIGSARGLEGSFSFGHITALGRDLVGLPESLRFRNFIQTDAAINFGNSGGPVCDLDGNVIGISVAIVYGANSLGFAIPVNTAKEIVPVLITDEKVTRGFLGVHIADARLYADALGLPNKQGAFVTIVQPGSPAERAKIKRYDVIRKVNGEIVEDASDLVRRISAIDPGTATQLEIWRDKKTMEVKVKLDEYAGNVEEAKKEKKILGLRVRELTPDWAKRMRVDPGTTGVVVVEVEPGSSAEEAGLMEGDIISEVAQEEVTSPEDFYQLMRENAKPGKTVLIGFIGREKDLRILILKVPKDAEIE